MKFGIWISASDETQIAAAVAKARDIGFDSVGLATSRAQPGVPGTSTGTIACIDGGATFSGQADADRLATDSLGRSLALARSLAVPLVKVRVETPGRRATASAVNLLAGSLLPSADQAAQLGVRLVVQNGAALPLVRDLWTLLDRYQHPALLGCWDASLAARAGEGPAVGVPVLNSRIALVEVRLSDGDASFEQGDSAVEELIHRLRGIGYEGHLLLSPQTAADAALQPLLARLRKWNERPVHGRKTSAAGHAAAGKIAAANAAMADRKKTPAASAGAG